LHTPKLALKKVAVFNKDLVKWIALKNQSLFIIKRA